MNEQWVQSPEFFAVWKGALKDSKKAFAGHSESAYASSKKYASTGTLWHLIYQPLPGIHLLDIEFPSTVTPHTIRFNVWVDSRFSAIYQHLLAAQTPCILGVHTFKPSKGTPRKSFEEDVATKGISLLGLRYRVDNCAFIYDMSQLGNQLSKMRDEFVAWLIEVYSDMSWALPDIVDQVPSPTSQPVDPTYPDELDPDVHYIEGAIKKVTVNAYERSAAARQACIDHHGFDCAACGTNFEERYGEIGRGFIHVHHLVPLHEMGGADQVDPVKDLRPVCPNCHAMLHRPGSLSIDQLRALIQRT